MKVNQIDKTDNIKYQNRKTFKGGGDIFLRYLATNQAVGANVVDLSFMVIPRTANDTIRRGPVCGLETGRREITGTTNHSLIGVYGIGAGALAGLVMGINGKYGIKSNKILAAPETVTILAENKARQIKNNKSQYDYILETLLNLKAFKGTDNGGSVSILGENRVEAKKLANVERTAKFLDETINKMPNTKKKFFRRDPLSKAIDAAVNMLTENTGIQSKYVLESLEGSPNSETSLRTLLEDICHTSNAFNSKKVMDSFKEQLSAEKGVAENKFIRSLTKFKNVKSIGGFLIASAIGASIQPLNMYMTKKKTGTDGFVGVEGRSKDTSTGFKFLKVGSAAAFGAMVLKTLDTGLKGFMSKMAFKGFWPTISQLKGVYGITIMSRLLAARDKDELRESFTKDFLGFLSWLVLGDFVNRMTAEALDKSVMTRSKEGLEKKNFFARALGSTLKNRDEILIKTLAENGISSTKEENGKIVAKSFKELLKDLNQVPEEARKLAKKSLKTLNRAQFAGYMFSGLVLGLGIPNLNIYITNTLDKKRKAKLAEKEAAEKAAA